METLLTILTAIFGGGWIAQIIFLRYERRKKIAETQGVEIDIEERQDEMQFQRLNRAYEQITRLQNIIDVERDKWVDLAKEASVLKIELLREQEARKMAEYNKCTVISCPNRTPPRHINNAT